MTLRMKPVTSTISACVITLAFSGPVIAGDFPDSILPTPAGWVDDGYLDDQSGAAERSDFAAYETKAKAEEYEPSQVGSRLTTSAGWVDDGYLDDQSGAAERSDFAAFEAESKVEEYEPSQIGARLPTSAGWVNDGYLDDEPENGR